MKKKYPFFYNEEPIKLITEFEKGGIGTFKSRSNNLNGIDNVEFKQNDNEYTVEFEILNIKVKKKDTLLGKVLKNVTLLTSEYELILKSIFIGSFTKGYINSFHTKGFSLKSEKYFKLIIPLEKSINFFFQLTTCAFQNERVFSRDSVSISIYDEDIYIIQESILINNKKYYFLVIESNKKQLFDSFADKAYAVRVAFGYIIGNLVGKKGYYFLYDNKSKNKFKSFCFQTQRGEIKNLYQPINSNPYAWLSSRNKKIAEKIYHRKDLRTLNKDEFSSLCKKCIENDDFLMVLLLMLESSTSSLLLRPGGYSIILEKLSAIIVGENEKKLNPITSKFEAKKFRTQLYEILKSFETNEHFRDIETLKGRIDNINQVTNKEKLVLPFKLLKIDLLKEDIRVINSRNDFLHGRIPVFRNTGKDRSTDEKDNDMYYASVRLYTLLNMLILKYIGYDNYIINFSKIYEKYIGYLVNEDYYRKI